MTQFQVHGLNERDVILTIEINRTPYLEIMYELWPTYCIMFCIFELYIVRSGYCLVVTVHERLRSHKRQYYYLRTKQGQINGVQIAVSCVIWENYRDMTEQNTERTSEFRIPNHFLYSFARMHPLSTPSSLLPTLEVD